MLREEFDLASLDQFMSEQHNLKDSEKEKVNNLMQLSQSFSFTLSQATELINGDTITVSYDFDDVLAEALNYDIIFDYPEYTVSALKELNVLTEEDVFGDLAIEYYGVSPHAEAAMKNNSTHPIMKELSYVITDSSGLAKGDVIRVEPIYDAAWLEEEGYVMDVDYIEYDVDRVGEYITSYNQLTEEGLKMILDQSADVVKSNINISHGRQFEVGDKWIRLNNAEDIVNMTLDKAYFFNIKNFNDISADDTVNRLLLWYTFDAIDVKNHFSNSLGDFEDIIVYTTVNNIIIDRDGNIDVDMGKMYISEDNLGDVSQKIETDAVITWLSNYELEEIDLKGEKIK